MGQWDKSDMTDLKSLANNVLSRQKVVPRAWDSGSRPEGLLGQETNRLHTIVLLGQPYSDEPDNDDPAEGRRIVEAVQAAGGWLRMWEGKIVLRWRGEIPNAGELIDRIRGNRLGVVRAVGKPS